MHLTVVMVANENVKDLLQMPINIITFVGENLD